MENLEELDKTNLYINKKNKTISFKWKYGQVNIDHNSGKITVEKGQEKSVNIIKRNYSATVLKQVAKKYNWLIKSKNKQQTKFVLKKR